MLLLPTSVSVAVASALLPALGVAQATGAYEATWESTDKHKASPDWFRDAKFGIYWHWGAFTTPQYANEWYPRSMYAPDSDERHHHTEVYGPPEKWGYQNFIKGAKDRKGHFVQFKPVLASKGGKFDPEAWMRVIKASGARFAGPVGEHHDGFSMWDSKVNEWNSAKLGPKIDLVKLWADLVRKNDMKFLVAMHHAFNSNGFYQWAPKTDDKSLQKLFGQLPRDQADQLWFDKHREMLDHVQPDMIWNDFALHSPGYCQGSSDTCAIGEQARLKFLSYYFNRGEEWNKEVLTTFKRFDQGFNDSSAVADYERGGPAGITRPYWLTDDAISESSWCYTDGIEYYSSISMVHSLLDRISKNGALLLNISPTAVGVVPDGQEKVLRDIGEYLSRYGESVYGTRAWDIYGEGPNRAGGGSFTSPLIGNSSDIRFTRSKDATTLYATILGWPQDEHVSISSLGSNALISLKGLQSVQLIGDKADQYTTVPHWEQSKDALEITLPKQPAESFAYVLKLNFRDRIPVPQPKQGATVFSATSATGPGVTLGQGDFNKVFLSEAGLDPASIRFIRVSPDTKIVVYANGDLSGATTNLGPGKHLVKKGSVGSIRISN
ncbi:hypothetical protein ACHAPJ_001967 [Fusarium lateritium]